MLLTSNVPDVTEGHPPPFAADRRKAMAELEEIVGFHVNLAEAAIKLRFRTHHSDTGLTRKQIAVLWLIGSCPGIIQVDLARLLQVGRATIQAVVRMFRVQGLIIGQGQGTTNGRQLPLRLTRQGLARLAAAKLAIRSHEAWLESRFTPAERQALVLLMLRLYRPARLSGSGDNLQEIHGAAAGEQR